MGRVEELERMGKGPGGRPNYDREGGRPGPDDRRGIGPRPGGRRGSEGAGPGPVRVLGVAESPGGRPGSGSEGAGSGPVPSWVGNRTGGRPGDDGESSGSGPVGVLRVGVGSGPGGLRRRSCRSRSRSLNRRGCGGDLREGPRVRLRSVRSEFDSELNQLPSSGGLRTTCPPRRSPSHGRWTRCSRPRRRSLRQTPRYMSSRNRAAERRIRPRPSAAPSSSVHSRRSSRHSPTNLRRPGIGVGLRC